MDVPALSVGDDLRIRPRGAWAGALLPVGRLEAEDVRFLLVHHTATRNQYKADEVPGLIRGVFNFHTGADKGWPDVAYNFFVDRFGTAWEGRWGSVVGPVRCDATGGSQGFAQLVCLIGDFTSEMPTDAALDTLVKLLAWLAERHQLDTRPGAGTQFMSRGSNLWPVGSSVAAATISAHREMSDTQCPGDTFAPFVQTQLQSLVQAWRDRRRVIDAAKLSDHV